MPSKFREYLLLNKNILIGFVGAFLVGAIISQVMVNLTSPLVNSLISIVSETGVFLSIFGFLFYFDNKDMFIDEQGRRKSGKVKWVLIKLASTLSVAEIEYNTVKPAIHFWLLTLDYQPFIASTIGSFIAIIGYLAASLLHVHYWYALHERGGINHFLDLDFMLLSEMVGERFLLSLPGFRRFLWFRYVIKENMIISMMASSTI